MREFGLFVVVMVLAICCFVTPASAGDGCCGTCCPGNCCPLVAPPVPALPAAATFPDIASASVPVAASDAFVPRTRVGGLLRKLFRRRRAECGVTVFTSCPTVPVKPEVQVPASGVCSGGRCPACPPRKQKPSPIATTGEPAPPCKEGTCRPGRFLRR